MRKPGGTGMWTDLESDRVVEVDTFSCAHCNKVVFVPPKADPSLVGGFCMMCMKHICGPCTDDGRCIPLERRLEQNEARGRALRSYGLM